MTSPASLLPLPNGSKSCEFSCHLKREFIFILFFLHVCPNRVLRLMDRTYAKRSICAQKGGEIFWCNLRIKSKKRRMESTPKGAYEYVFPSVTKLTVHLGPSQLFDKASPHWRFRRGEECTASSF